MLCSCFLSPLSLPLSLFHFFTFPASLLLSATLKSKHWQAMNQRGLFLLLLWECLQHTENSACALTLCIFSEKLTGFQSQWTPVKPTQGFMYMSYTLGVCVDPHRPSEVKSGPTWVAQKWAAATQLCSLTMLISWPVAQSCERRNSKLVLYYQELYENSICGLIKLFLLPTQPNVLYTCTIPLEYS